MSFLKPLGHCYGNAAVGGSGCLFQRQAPDQGRQPARQRGTAQPGVLGPLERDGVNNHEGNSNPNRTFRWFQALQPTIGSSVLSWLPDLRGQSRGEVRRTRAAASRGWLGLSSRCLQMGGTSETGRRLLRCCWCKKPLSLFINNVTLTMWKEAEHASKMT